MNRLAAATVVVALFLSLRSMACAQHVPDDGTIPWGDPDSGFEIALSGPSTIQSGEPIPLTYWIGALSKDTIRVALPQIDFAVLDANGQTVMPQQPLLHGPGNFSGNGMPGFNLAKGRAFRLNRPSIDLARFYKLGPGVYTITAQWTVQRAIDVYQFEYNHGSIAPALAHPVSKPITLTVE